MHLYSPRNRKERPEEVHFSPASEVRTNKYIIYRVIGFNIFTSLLLFVTMLDQTGYRGRRDRDRMVVGFTTTYAMNALRVRI